MNTEKYNSDNQPTAGVNTENEPTEEESLEEKMKNIWLTEPNIIDAKEFKVPLKIFSSV